MKRLLIVGGLFIVIFICIVPLNRDIKEYYVQKKGEIVTAKITYLPICRGTKLKYFMTFNYAGQQFDKRVGCGFAGMHKIGEAIRLRHMPGSNIFLFENEKKESEFISTGLLAVFGMTLIVIGLRQK